MNIAPSLLAADFSALGREVSRVSGADMLHIDVMDGRFVPNLGISPQIVAHLRDKTALPFDVHLMLEHPLPYVDIFRNAGADIITFHIECADDPARVLEAIQKSGAKAGLALKPATPVEAIFPYGESLRQVTVMTVEPGFGGQKLMPEPLQKISLLKDRFPKILAEVDGGVNRDTVSLCRSAGADILVAGTAVFHAEDPGKEMDFLRRGG